MATDKKIKASRKGRSGPSTPPYNPRPDAMRQVPQNRPAFMHRKFG